MLECTDPRLSVIIIIMLHILKLGCFSHRNNERIIFLVAFIDSLLLIYFLHNTNT